MQHKNILCIFLLAVVALSSILHCSAKKDPKLTEIQEKVLPGGDKRVDPVQALIAEIELVNGVQKFVYYKVDKDNEWYKEGLNGFIFNDVEMKKKVGKFKVVKIHKKFSQGEIIELYFPIDPKAIVYIEVDPRKLID